MDGFCLSPRQHRHPHQVCASVQGLTFSCETGDRLGNAERRRRLPPNASGLLVVLFSKDFMPVDRPVPNCRVAWVRFLLIAVPGRSSRPPEPMTHPGALKGAGDHFITVTSQPQPAQHPQGGGGVFRPSTQAKPYPTWVTGCRIDESANPCRSRGLSAWLHWSCLLRGAVHCSLAGQKAPAPNSANAVSFTRTQTPRQTTAGVLRLCRAHAIQFSGVPAAAHFNHPSAEQHAKRCSGSSGMRD